MKTAPQFLVVLLLLFSLSGFAQKTDSLSVDSLRKDAINIYIDCNSCDITYIKQNILFVNYVRDTKEAQVHLLITSDMTGSGGTEYSLFFIGQEKYKGINDTLKHSFSPNATSDEIREKMVDLIKTGLIRYVSKTPLIENITIKYENNGEAQAEVKDKWNYWVFQINSSGNVSAQSSSSSFYLWSSFNINRTTEKSKVSFNFGNNYNEQRFKMDDQEIIGLNRSYYFNNLYVKSLSKHWSAGAYTSANSSTYSNIDLSYGIRPAIEYNVFPYSDYNRRKLCLNYSIGVDYNDYTDTTVYFKTKETTGLQNLSVSYQTIQKWGSVYLSLDGSALLNDFKKNHLNMYTSIEWRVFKGFSLNLSTSYSIVRDQIGLAKGEASVEDVLLSQRQLQTDFTLWTYFGVSYTFGSIYNNIVNPRF